MNTKKTLGTLVLSAFFGVASASSTAQAESPQRFVKAVKKYEFSRDFNSNNRELRGAMVLGAARYDLACSTEVDPQGISYTACFVDGGEFGTIDGVVDARYQGKPQEAGQDDFVFGCLDETNYDAGCVPFEKIPLPNLTEIQLEYEALIGALFRPDQAQPTKYSRR